MHLSSSVFERIDSLNLKHTRRRQGLAIRAVAENSAGGECSRVGRRTASRKAALKIPRATRAPLASYGEIGLVSLGDRPEHLRSRQDETPRECAPLNLVRRSSRSRARMFAPLRYATSTF